MEAPDFTIDQDDLRILFLHIRNAYPKHTLEDWIVETKQSYTDYRKRNLDNLERYGEPKTFSQWINGQIIALTT